MRQPYTLTVTTADGAVVSFQDVEMPRPYWERLPLDARDFLAWPVDESAYISCAMLITLESGEERKKLYALGYRGPAVVAPGTALSIGGDIIFIISDQVARLDVANWRIAWHVAADSVTCFGMYPDPDDASAVIIHGELDITKVSLDGAIIWQVGGADIFVQPADVPAKPIMFNPGAVIATDWNGCVYIIDTTTGDTTVEKPEADKADRQN